MLIGRRMALSAILLVLLGPSLDRSLRAHAAGVLVTGTRAAGLQPNDLTCEYRVVATDIDLPNPRLSWTLVGGESGDRQTGYQVQAASSIEQLAADRADLWDSGTVRSDESLNISYAGTALHSLQRCYWKVRVWDKNHAPSAWSQPTSFLMGILNAEDWKAHWISTLPLENGSQRLPLLRRRLLLNKGVRTATLTICGLGQFEVHVNGNTIHDPLQPGWTDYAKTDLYVTYDLTRRLEQGENVIGVMLGNGMYDVPADPTRYAKFRHSFGRPMMIAVLRLNYADGSTESIGTDAAWKTAPGPITFSSIYGGEDEDARLEPAFWDRPLFDDSLWAAATLVNGPGGVLRGSSHSALPLRVEHAFKPKQISTPRPGVRVYDLGQNCAMVPRIEVRGPAGSIVKISPAELLGPDGLIDARSIGGGPTFFQYTLCGNGLELWMPRFSYCGARYLQVETTPATNAPATDLPQLTSVQGWALTSSALPLSRFVCSNDQFNRTYQLIRWAQLNNTVSLLTDCPARERLGWLEQDHLNGPSLMENFSLAPLFEKVANDIADAQQPSGLVPDIAPEYTVFAGGFRDSPEWGSAAILVPWQTYQWYGDRQILTDHYDTMKRYVAYLRSKLTADGLLHFGLGDWYDLGPKPPGPAQLTPTALTATAFYCHDLDVLSRIAGVLGDAPGATEFRQQKDAAVARFNAAFWNPNTRSYSTSSQTANAIPLVFGFAAPADESTVVGHLVDDIRRHGNALTAGDIGYRYLLRALVDHGRSDVIFDMNSANDHPGYGYQLARGATSLAEAWDAGPNASQDHFMLGHLTEWFYADLAGISQEPDSVAFRHLRIRPNVVGDVTSVQANYWSVRGNINVVWSTDAQRTLALRVDVPPGSDANIYLPTRQGGDITENGKLVDRFEATVPPEKDLPLAGTAVLHVDSGSYRFTSELPARSPASR